MATYDSTYSGRGGRPDLRDRPMHLHWWAVFGGGVVGWGLLFFLSLLGLTIGLAAIEPYSARPASGIDVGSAVWGLAALVLSSIVGAYLVVRIAGERRRREAALHAVVSWGLSMIAGALLAMGAGRTVARASAENPPRTSARTDVNGTRLGTEAQPWPARRRRPRSRAGTDLHGGWRARAGGARTRRSRRTDHLATHALSPEIDGSAPVATLFDPAPSARSPR